jgi:hypothetical protein
MRQRILSALVALLSLFALSARLTWAQDTPTSSEPAATQEASETGDVLTLKAGEKVSSLIVRDRTLVIEGEVTHDVVAFNSEVVVKQGAKVGGNILLFKGSSMKASASGFRAVGDPEKALEQKGEVRVPASEGETVSSQTHADVPARPAMITQVPLAETSEKRNDFSGNQFGMLLFGLVGGLILFLVAPRATEQATDTLASGSGRCLVVGAMGGFGLLVASLVNAMAMKSPFSLLWSPIGTLTGILTLIVLTFGWLCGMRLVGDLVAKKFRRYEEGHLLGRIALGLIVFCFAKLLLFAVGGSWLGGAALVLEAIVAVMGLGALLVSGFGTNPDWLGARLRGERRWLSRR